MKHKIKMYAGVHTLSHCNEGKVSLCEYDFRQIASIHETRSFLAEVEVEVELPEFNLHNMKLEILEKRLEIEVSEAATRQANLRQQIQDLKCLTHDQ